MDLEVGTRIGDRYVVLGDLGAGGMGIVLRARDERLGRLVALKLLPPATVGDEASRKRLVREARAAAALDHTNIVHVYDVGETPEGGAFLVMELVKGRSLGEHLRNGTLTVAQRVRAIVDVAHALQYAHDQGFLHRDIKPDNLMVRDDGRVVVLDFGLAKVIAPGLGTTAAASLVSSKSAFVGTPAYVSPEQAVGDELDAKTDQFSLGVSLFEMVTGELPWDGDTPLAVISHIIRGEPKKLRAVAPGASEALEGVIARALEKDRAKRYATIADFGDAVAAATPEMEHAPSLRNVGIGPAQSVAAAQLRTLSAPARSIRVVSRSQSRWRVRAMLAVAVVAVASTVGYAAFRKKQAPIVPFAMTPKSTVACPLLRATDPDLQQAGLSGAGWLGAAAATLVCSRVAMALGGSPDRTQIPAELLGLPRQPKEGFPTAPFEEPDALAKTLTEAKKADVYIDGVVDHASDFHVTLDLRVGSDVVEHGEARGSTLSSAVALAMVPLVARLAPGVDAAYAGRWFAGTSVEGRLAAFDLHVLVLAEDTPGIHAACAELPTADLGSLAPFATALCAKQLFRPLPALPPLDTSSTGALLSTASALRFPPTTSDADRDAQLARAAKLREAASAEADLGAKALLLAGEAEIEYQVGDNNAAALAARSSIQASPRIADVRANAWHRQAFVTQMHTMPVLAAHAAWVPWEPYAQANLGDSINSGDPRGYQRAYVLAQHGYWAVEYGRRLLELGKLVEARGVAAATHDPRLEVLLSHVDRRPGLALTQAIASLRALAPAPENGNVATKLSANIVDLDALLGKPVDGIVTDYVERFVMPEPPALTRGATTLFGVLAVCTQLKGTVGDKCIERLAALFDGGYFGGGIPSARDGIDGARLYLKGDVLGAAKAWRPVTGEWLAEVMRGPLATAFDKAGDLELADRVDDPPVATGKTSPEVELCYVRKALRAEKRGDQETAQKIARVFVTRWDGADERPPMVVEMKRLLAKPR